MSASIRVALPPIPRAAQRRVVVTGLGCVTPLGVGVQRSWEALLAGACGIRQLDAPLNVFPTRVAGCVPRGLAAGEFSLEAAVGRAHLRSQGVDFIGFAQQAAAEALQDAGLNSEDPGSSHVGPFSRDAFGVSIGSGIGSLDESAAVAVTFAELGLDAGQRKVSPFFVPRLLVNMAAGNVSIRHGLRGPNHAAATACATGAHAIGDAFRLIKYGDADAMLAGGTESCINPLALAGFSRAKAMATRFNDDPGAASRPFDARRDGFVLGEGAGVLVLEEREAARARGARIYAEIRGYGLSGDAFHITAPREDGSGALRCMRAALHEAGLSPDDVDHVNAHATSTPLGDVIEGRALGALFGSVCVPSAHSPSGRRALLTTVSASKGATGHLLGAAGAVESIFAVLAVHTGRAPPTLNLEQPDEALPHDVCEFVRLRKDVGSESGLEGRSTDKSSGSIRVALKNSFGFGGTNASLVFARDDEV